MRAPETGAAPHRGFLGVGKSSRAGVGVQGPPGILDLDVIFDFDGFVRDVDGFLGILRDVQRMFMGFWWEF